MREDGISKIEVHVAGICFNGRKVLILKRSPGRKLYPNLWECGGGQVEAGESFEDAVKRQLREEAGVIIEPVKLAGTYQISADGSKIPGIYFACKFKGFSNGIAPKTSSEHTEWKWQDINSIDDIEFIPGLKQNITIANALL